MDDQTAPRIYFFWVQSDFRAPYRGAFIQSRKYIRPLFEASLLMAHGRMRGRFGASLAVWTPVGRWL